jgi:signal transduction histidine kinase
MDVDEHEDAELRRLERGAAVDDAGAPLFEAAALLDGIRRIDAADPAGSLVTCVKELFDNALDACAAHATGRIDVSVEPLDADGSLFQVEVTDDGCGFESGVLSVRATELFASSKGSSKELGGASAGTFGAESCDAVGASLIPRWPRPFVFL